MTCPCCNHTFTQWQLRWAPASPATLSARAMVRGGQTKQLNYYIHNKNNILYHSFQSLTSQKVRAGHLRGKMF